jgi:hypothetical protein
MSEDDRPPLPKDRHLETVDIADIDDEIERLTSTRMLRQCKGTNRAGARCRRSPIKGGAVCALHGGKAPQVVAAAKRRLLEAAEPVVAGLIEIFEDEAHVEPRDRIRAGFGILDRAGLSPNEKVNGIGVVNAQGGNVLLYMPENGRRSVTLDVDEDELTDEVEL